MPMVSYWKTKSSVQAKVIRAADGSIQMILDGEKEPFPTFPRGYLLYGRLSKLKHEIKNQIFNASWWKLEAKGPKRKVIADIKRDLFGEIAEIADSLKYEIVPAGKMCASVRELHRALTKIGFTLDNNKQKKLYLLRDYVCLILQEDDGYRNRLQWLIKFFHPLKWLIPLVRPENALKRALGLLEHAEVIDDMKERARLLKRVVLLALEDKFIYELFIGLCKEMNWNKIGLTRADKYHFRGKYFKVDYPEIEY